MTEPLSSKDSMKTDPFSIKHKLPMLSKPGLKWLSKFFDRTLKLARMNHIANDYGDLKPTDFFRIAQRVLRLKVRYKQNELARVPTSGPVLVTCNHPTGLAETIILFNLLLSTRPDIKFIANDVLAALPNLDDVIIPFNPFDTMEARRSNRAAIKEAFDWLKSGGLLVVFPSGTVSQLKVTKKTVKDPMWSELPIRLLQRTDAQLVPFYISGKNSWRFHMAGFIHPLLRTSMIPNELFNKAYKPFRLTIGEPMWLRDIPNHGTPKKAAEYLYDLTYALSYRRSLDRSKANKKEKYRTKIANGKPANLLIEEINNIRDECLVAEQKEFSVYAVRGHRVPNIMHEIARLREVTYRGVGEGTGKPLDTDEYDDYYYQVFMWDHINDCLVGGYRVAVINEVIEQHGLKGSYLSSLYEINPDLFKQKDRFVELGRSFICDEYQGQFLSLLLLWRGVATLIIKLGGIRHLIGLVSVSPTEYSKFACQFLIAALRHPDYRSELAHFMTPHSSYTADRQLPEAIKTLTKNHLDFNEMKAAVENITGRPFQIPVLIKHYISQMNGKCMRFSVDDDFGGAIDVMLYVDLAKSTTKSIGRYFGKENADYFIKLAEQHDAERPTSTTTSA